MNTILDALKDFFTASGFPFIEHPEGASLMIGVAGGDTRFPCYALPIDDGRFAFHAIAPVTVPVGKRMLVAELLTRVNHGLWTGCFELDVAEGIICFRTSGVAPAAGLGDDVIEPLFLACTGIMETYLPGLFEVIYGNRAPAEVVGEIEGRMDGGGPPCSSSRRQSSPT